MTGKELRVQLRMQQARNSNAKECNDTTGNVAHYRWRVTGSRCGVYEVCFLPEATHAEVSALYLGATVEPMQPLVTVENSQ